MSHSPPCAKRNQSHLMLSYLLESNDDICPRQAGLHPCFCLRTKSRICAVVARSLAPLLTPRPSNSPLLHQAPPLSCPPDKASWSYVCSEPTPRALHRHSADAPPPPAFSSPSRICQVLVTHTSLALSCRPPAAGGGARAPNTGGGMPRYSSSSLRSCQRIP